MQTTAPASSTLKTNRTPSTPSEAKDSEAKPIEEDSANPLRKSRSLPHFQTTHAIKPQAALTETTPSAKLRNNSADSTHNSAIKQKTANQVASLRSNKETLQRETDKRGAGHKLRRVPRKRKRRPPIHPRSKIEDTMAYRRGGNTLHTPSSPRPTQARSQRDQIICSKRHPNPVLWRH